jgi:hypothetical protein
MFILSPLPRRPVDIILTLRFSKVFQQNIVTCKWYSDYRRGSIDNWIYWTQLNHTTRDYTLQSTVRHTHTHTLIFLVLVCFHWLSSLSWVITLHGPGPPADPLTVSGLSTYCRLSLKTDFLSEDPSTPTNCIPQLTRNGGRPSLYIAWDRTP